jgi:hypothetical protein
MNVSSSTDGASLVHLSLSVSCFETQAKRASKFYFKMTCCGIMFLVVALFAMGCSLAALWLPMVMVVPENGAPTFPSGGSSSSSSSNGDAKHSMLAMLGTRAHAAALKTPRSFKQQELSGLPDGTAQCPFFNNFCYIDDVKLEIDNVGLHTDDLVLLANCNALGTLGDNSKTRFWVIVSAALSCATVLVGCGHAHKGNDFGSNAALIKFGAAAIAGGHVGASALVFILEGPIASCLQDFLNGLYETLHGTYYIIFLSLLVTAVAAGLNFFNAIGMMLSYCMGCCGAPAGRDIRTMLGAQYTYGGQPLINAAQPAYDAYGRVVVGTVQAEQQPPATGYPMKY